MIGSERHDNDCKLDSIAMKTFKRASQVDKICRVGALKCMILKLYFYVLLFTESCVRNILQTYYRGCELNTLCQCSKQ